MAASSVYYCLLSQLIRALRWSRIPFPGVLSAGLLEADVIVFWRKLSHVCINNRAENWFT